jgi:hypothetical protein
VPPPTVNPLLATYRFVELAPKNIGVFSSCAL